MIISYLKYCWQRKGAFRIHSPFVFDYVTKALHKSSNYDYEKLYSVYRVIDKHRFCTPSARIKAQLIYKTASYFNAENIAIAGETKAMNIAAIAMSCPKVQLHTTAWREAYDELESLGINSLKLIDNETLLKNLDSDDREPFVLFLASPTEGNDFLKHTQPDDIIIIDNIHRTRENEHSWNELKDNDLVKFSFDIYHIGILFFKQGFEKQNFVLKWRS